MQIFQTSGGAHSLGAERPFLRDSIAYFVSSSCHLPGVIGGSRCTCSGVVALRTRTALKFLFGILLALLRVVFPVWTSIHSQKRGCGAFASVYPVTLADHPPSLPGLPSASTHSARVGTYVFVLLKRLFLFPLQVPASLLHISLTDDHRFSRLASSRSFTSCVL